MSSRKVIILDYSDYQLLKQGPSIHGLFTDEGRDWAKLKQGEPMREYSSSLSGQITQKLGNILNSLI